MLPIYLVTLKQLLRQSNLWYVNIFAIVTSEIAPAFAELFTFGNKEIAVIESVKASVYLSVILSAIVCIYKIMSKELNLKVAVNIFAKPIEFKTFMLAKYLGMMTVIIILCLFQAILVYKHSWYLNWSPEGINIAFASLYGVFLQGACLISFAMMLSVAFNKFFSLFLIILVLFIPYMIPNEVLIWVSFVIPALSWFDFSEMVYKNIPVGLPYLCLLSMYCIFYSVFSIFIADILLKRKEF
jgi:ABC-type transport system involved in multi-copper enzyme maturation permease subunit